MVAFQLLSLPVLNWPFLIFSANSIPLIVTAALSNRLNPSNSLFDSPVVLFDEIVQVSARSTLTLLKSSSVSFISLTARCDAA